MSVEYTIEWCNPNLCDWQPLPQVGMTPLTAFQMTYHPIGEVKTIVGSSGVSFDYRRVPKDPLLKAIVLAQNQANAGIQNLSAATLDNIPPAPYHQDS